MEKIKIFNRSLISNKEIAALTTLPLWISIVSFVTAIILTTLPIVIRSNDSVEKMFQQNPEIITAIQGVFKENETCEISQGKIANCSPNEKEISGVTVGLNRKILTSPSISFTSNKMEAMLKVQETDYLIQMPYEMDFAFNQVEKKEIVSFELVNQLISSAQVVNVVNGFVVIATQCLLYIGVGMISLYSTTYFRFKKKMKIKDLFKIQGTISVSGGLVAFVLCFVIDPLVSFATTIFLFNILIRTFDISLKMKQFTF